MHFEILRPVLSEEELRTFQVLRNPKRKAEWLAARMLLLRIRGKHTPVCYNSRRKPSLADGTKISISHTHGFVGVILSKTNRNVGIDLEILSEKILRPLSKFINPEILFSQSSEEKIFEAYLHWCGKETIFKIINNQELNFKDDLKIKIFSLQEKGFVIGSFSKGKTSIERKINYRLLNNSDKKLLLMWS